MKTTNDATHFWDEAYQSGQYLNRWEYKHPSPELVAIVALGMTPAGGNCLDMGCGAGNEIIFLAQNGYRATGIDFSLPALEIAKERAKTKNVVVTLINASATDTGLENNSFDFINDRGCFHHIPIEGQKDYANEVCRLLKPGGRIMIRGCRETNMPGFQKMDENLIDKLFDATIFTRGPILPITLISDTGSLNCNIVIITKK